MFEADAARLSVASILGEMACAAERPPFAASPKGGQKQSCLERAFVSSYSHTATDGEEVDLRDDLNHADAAGRLPVSNPAAETL